MRGKQSRASAPLDIGQLYADHGESVLLFLARRTADPQIALDLWAETFAQALEGRSRFRASAESAAEARWLFGIARNLLAGYYRRGEIEQRALGRLKLERAPATPEVLAQLEAAAALGDLRRELGAALSELSPGVRAAVSLRVVHELDYSVVAERLGISEGTARVRVSRGLASLARLLDRADLEEQPA